MRSIALMQPEGMLLDAEGASFVAIFAEAERRGHKPRGENSFNKTAIGKNQ